MRSPDCLIVIPQKGHQAMTGELVRQIRAFEDAAVLVVDDGSPRGEFEPDALELMEGVHVIDTAGVGLTAAWNIGLAHAAGRPVLLLNNDVACRGPFLAALVEAAGPAGISGVSLRYDRDAEMDVLEGWCMCLGPRLAARQRFDESMRLYFSDTDYQLRAKVVPKAVDVPLRHIGHVTCHDKDILHPAERRVIWRSDRRVFRNRWMPHA